MYYIYKLEVMPLQDNKDIQYRGIEEANVLKNKKVSPFLALTG